VEKTQEATLVRAETQTSLERDKSQDEQIPPTIRTAQATPVLAMKSCIEQPVHENSQPSLMAEDIKRQLYQGVSLQMKEHGLQRVLGTGTVNQSQGIRNRAMTRASAQSTETQGSAFSTIKTAPLTQPSPLGASLPSNTSMQRQTHPLPSTQGELTTSITTTPFQLYTPAGYQSDCTCVDCVADAHHPGAVAMAQYPLAPTFMDPITGAIVPFPVVPSMDLTPTASLNPGSGLLAIPGIPPSHQMAATLGWDYSNTNGVGFSARNHDQVQNSALEGHGSESNAIATG
jgi:hypothetical protein